VTRKTWTHNLIEKPTSGSGRKIKSFWDDVRDTFFTYKKSQPGGRLFTKGSGKKVSSKKISPANASASLSRRLQRSKDHQTRAGCSFEIKVQLRSAFRVRGNGGERGGLVCMNPKSKWTGDRGHRRSCDRPGMQFEVLTPGTGNTGLSRLTWGKTFETT